MKPPSIHEASVATAAATGLVLLAASLTASAQPAITRQPTNVSVSIGATAQFRVLASTTSPPLTYQWLHRDTLLTWGTNGTLTLTNIQLSDAGSYRAAVSDATGSTNSQPAALDVDGTFTKVTTGPLVTNAGRWFAASWADYNNDGYPDLYVWQLVPAQQDFLYRNDGDGTFTPMKASWNGAPWGTAWGDYDNDGYLDLFIPNAIGGKNVLLHNRGNGSFEKITTGPGADGSLQSSTAAWGDYDRDGFLDLLVLNGDRGNAAAQNWLYHNQGDGTFLKTTTNQVGYLASQRVRTVLSSWVDYDDDGWPDLFMPALYRDGYFNRNLGAGSFVLLTNGVVQPDIAETFAWADYDNDGHLDLCISIYGKPTALYHNNRDGTFARMTSHEVGSLVSDKSQFGGVAWGDYDNDGYVDLFVAGGWWNGVQVSTRSFLYHNSGDGTFTSITTGSPVNELSDSMGVHWVDYDRDGFLDLFVNAHGEAKGYAPNLLYRNNRNSNNWLCVTCVGTASPSDGTGVKVRATATIRTKETRQLRLINSGGTCWGGQSFEAHFGLGDATTVDTLRIEWPSGIVQELKSISANQFLTITEQGETVTTAPNLAAVKTDSGAVQLTLTGQTNALYIIEASTNLVQWAKMAVRTIVTGSVEITDSAAAKLPQRLYRAVAP